MTSPVNLPSFFVVGAQKAGTTSLHHWLAQQPDICLPRLKETHFFSSDEKYQLGIEWYIDQFPKCRKNSVIGEIAPEYMFSKKAPYRIAKWINSPKMIFIFRHPIERAFSQYLMAVSMGYENLTFRRALLEEYRRISRDQVARSRYGYMTRGRYAEQIERYSKVFPDAELLFIKFDDLIAQSKTGLVTYRRICDFIGLKSSPEIADRSIKSNPASIPKSRLLRDFLYRPSRLKKVLGTLIPNRDIKERIADLLVRLNQHRLPKPPMERVPMSIIDLTREEIRRLQEMTLLKLSAWCAHTDYLASVQTTQTNLMRSRNKTIQH